MSRCLSDRAIEHVVLERGRIGERWRSERWDSLTLLTPNWQTRLPGFRYAGGDPDGYMSMPQLIAFLERYASAGAAPIETSTNVLDLRPDGSRFALKTTRGSWLARNVVIATGYSDLPRVPPIARRLARRVAQIVPSEYRHPDQLPGGGVLVVGASATGVQLAEEIHASGRAVTLAVGRHQRLPRTYRGRDILWWLDAMGVFDETAEQVFDLETSRQQPSLQLVGRADTRSLDVALLRARGVHVVGRLVDGADEQVSFKDDLIQTTVASDFKLAQLLQRIDGFIEATGCGHLVAPAEPFEPTWTSAIDVEAATVDLRAAGIETVLWATGFRRQYPWLQLPLFDEHGEIRHRGGVTPVPGVFVLGMHFQRRRKSAFIDGVGDDAAFVADRILDRGTRRTADASPAEERPWSTRLTG